jgi:hypothetical protein
MRTISIAIATAVLLSGAAFAADPPGQQMKDEPGGPGASENAPPSGANETTPGQQMQEDTGPGASQYAPGEPNPGGANSGKSADAPGHTKRTE